MDTAFSIQISRIAIGIVLSFIFLIMALLNSEEATLDIDEKRSLSSALKHQVGIIGLILSAALLFIPPLTDKSIPIYTDNYPLSEPNDLAKQYFPEMKYMDKYDTCTTTFTNMTHALPHSQALINIG